MSHARRSSIQASPFPQRVLRMIVVIVCVTLLPPWIRALQVVEKPLEPPARVTQEPHPIRIPWTPQVMDSRLGSIATAAQRYGVDPELYTLIILVESAGNPNAVSEAGATGLAQIMPATAELVRKNRDTTVQLDNPVLNLDVGARLLGEELTYFVLPLIEEPPTTESVAKAAAAYNAGRMAALQLDFYGLSQGGDCATLYPWDSQLDLNQMQRYACFVSGMWTERYEPMSKTYTYWLASGGTQLIIESMHAN